jgi:hypothetical protein
LIVFIRTILRPELAVILIHRAVSRTKLIWHTEPTYIGIILAYYKIRPSPLTIKVHGPPMTYLIQLRTILIHPCVVTMKRTILMPNHYLTLQGYPIMMNVNRTSLLVTSSEFTFDL